MFAKLKKKVEDLEGSDLHKLANTIGFSAGAAGPEKSSSQLSLKSSDNLSASQSHRGSTTSLSSTQGIIKPEEQNDSSIAIEKKWKQRLFETENEWRVKIMVHEHEKEQLIKERDGLLQLKKKMEDEVKEMKGYREKCLEVEENLRKLQESKNHESTHFQILLDNVSVEVEDLKAKDEHKSQELTRKEEEIQMLQNKLRLTQTVQQQDASPKDTSLDNSEEVKQMQEMMASKDGELNRLQRQLDQVKSSLDTMTQNWQNEKAMNMSLQDKLAHMSEEKNSFVVRNAELKQQLSLSQQQLQRTEKEMSEFQAKATKMQEEAERCKHLLSDAEARDENSERVNSLRSQVAELEAAITEKNKTMKLQQQRLADMKKTLQKEFKNQGNELNSDNLSPLSASGLSPAPSRKAPPSSPVPPGKNDMDEVNFKYLKHVIFKFLTSREYEAQHLTRAVSTLLKLTPDEEKLLKETLEWKMSWFQKKPDLGTGQSAMYIPPTH